MRKKISAIAFVAALCLSASAIVAPVQASVATQYVAIGQSNGTNTGCDNPAFGTTTYDGSAYWAVKHALKTVAEGGRVYLCAGEYDFTTGLRLNNSNVQTNIVIAGAGAGKTVLDGLGSYRVLWANFSSGQLTIQGLTIQNSFGFEGGALCQAGDFDLVINQVSFINNESVSYGGAIGCTNGNSLRITNSLFKDNDAGSHGGAIDVHQDEGTFITGTDFIGNHSDSDGGALGANGSNPLEVQNSRFIGNTSGENGGAIWFTRDEIKITRSMFMNNVASGTGGAVALRSGLTGAKRRIAAFHSFRKNRSSLGRSTWDVALMN
jgi:predicted outer membrane repeat protein